MRIDAGIESKVGVIDRAGGLGMLNGLFET